MSAEILSSETIKGEAVELGFSACGIAKAEAVDEVTSQHFQEWIAQGHQAEMHYMENHLDKRLDPRLLMDGLKTIVCVALNYTPLHRLPDGEYQIAAYALGQDYHDIVKQKLHHLASRILSPLKSHLSSLTSHPSPLNSYRAFSDSAPILERYWAVRAGLGWVGRNHQLIIPPHTSHPSPLTSSGSMFFLGELFLTQEVDLYDQPMKSRCGTCRRCIDACPTHALTEDTHSFDAHQCLSYQTIENRGAIPPDMAAKMSNTIYGCDRCQQACPWNRFAAPTTEPTLMAKQELLSMTRVQWQQLSQEDYQRLFKGSAVKRAKYEGLMRNIRAVSDTTDDTDSE